MRKWLILISALFTAPLAAAPAWTWVDNNGTVHYSDRPVPGARQVEIAGAQTFGPPPAATQQAPAGATSPAREQPTEATAPYRVFNIESPAQQETLWNIGTTLNVQLSLQPPLQSGHRLDVFVDGERKNLNVQSTQFAVPDVFRGVHTLQAVVIDERGREVLRSLATTFMVQQTSIQNPNAPLARPPRASGN